MSYARYENHAGRECGYAVEATCDHPGCAARIDRGYDYLCGGPDRIQSGDGPGCGGYFCEAHRSSVGETKGGDCMSLCDACKVDPRTLAYLVDEENPGDGFPFGVAELWAVPENQQFSDGVGPAFDRVGVAPDGTMWIGNGESFSQVNFCPMTGKAAAKAIVPLMPFPKYEL